MDINAHDGKLIWDHWHRMLYNYTLLMNLLKVYLETDRTFDSKYFVQNKKQVGGVVCDFQRKNSCKN